MRSRHLLTPLVVLAAALAVALPAQAGKPSHLTPHAPAYKTATGVFVDDVSGDFQVATVACPAGQKVLSGGFKGTAGDFATTNKALDDHTWVVKGAFSVAGAKAFAYCSAGLTVETAQTTAHIPAYDTVNGGDNDRAVSANPEIEELVRNLEASQEESLELGHNVTADDIAQEFQRFLRQRGTDKN